jgi:8-oxo-dGTP diphosphatase
MQLSFENIKDRIVTFVKGILSKKTEYADVIIRNSEGKILLLHRGFADGLFSGKWGFPGGHVDEGEDFKTAAIREALEETGLKLADCRLIHIEDKVDCVIHYFEAFICGGTEQPLDSLIILDTEEHRGYEWVEPSKVSSYDLVANLSAYVDKDVLSKLFPITVINAKFTNPEEKIAEVGGTVSLEEAWEVLQKAFDEGQISPEQYVDARNNYLRAKEKEIQKGGEGSKGGEVIGHTASGKPIYTNENHSAHKGFNKQEKEEAGYHREKYHIERQLFESHFGHDTGGENIERKKRRKELIKKIGSFKKSEDDEISSPDEALEIIKAGFDQGIVTEDEYFQSLEKGGVGSGRKPIGFTRSGKEIYDHKDEVKQYDGNDHADAFRVHKKLAKEHEAKAKEATTNESRAFHQTKMHKHNNLAKWHDETGSGI